jgi:hypothetical protein
MSVDSAVHAGRRAAESRMTSRATVRRKTGEMTQDESTGYEVPVWDTVYTNLPFRSSAGSSSDGGSRAVTIGGVTFERATGVGHFPAVTADLTDDDLIDVTEGEWAGDVFRIVAAIRYDQKTARRLPIVEESRPEEWV